MNEVIRCKGSKICSPFFAHDTRANDTIYYVSAGTGDIFACSLSQGSHTSVAFSGGEPLGAAFDSKGRLHIADSAHAALLRVDDHGQPAVMVKAYEEKPLRGPSSVAFAENESVYFTDSGPLGDTTLERPRGSVFLIGPSPSGGQTLRPVALECLAYPSSITISASDKSVLYVTELLSNRLLRLVQRPVGTHFVSVFHNFEGKMGPSCVVSDRQGRIYVGHYDFAGIGDSQGRITVLNTDGRVEKTITIPGPEITGICLSHDESSLFVTEASTNALHRIVLH